MPQVQFQNASHTWWDHYLMNAKEYCRLVDLCRNRSVIEIGSFRGGSSELIAPRAKSLICIDPHMDMHWGKNDDGSPVVVKGSEVQAEFKASIAGYSNVQYLQLRSDDAVGQIKRTVDIVFIDGDHSYYQCLQDLLNYSAFAKRYILVHDFCTQFGAVVAACINFFQREPDELCDTLAIYKVKK